MILEFGEKHPEAEYRRSIGSIIFNPESTKVLALDWKMYSVYGIVQGGQDTGENEIETLKREIVEETGYTDFEIGEKLGDNIISYFYADNKQVWRKSELSVYLVNLNTLSQDQQKLEDNENFELKWVEIDHFIKLCEDHVPTKSQNFLALREFLVRAKNKKLI